MTIEFDKKKVIEACNTSNPYAGLDALEQLVKAHNELYESFKNICVNYGQRIKHLEENMPIHLRQKIKDLQQSAATQAIEIADMRRDARNTIIVKNETEKPVNVYPPLVIPDYKPIPVTQTEWNMYQALIKQMKEDIRAFVGFSENEDNLCSQHDELYEKLFLNLKRHCDE